AAQPLAAAAERRVRVEDALAVAQEAAEAGLLDRLVALEVVTGAARLVLGPGGVVVGGGRDRVVDGDAEVVVEVAAMRRVPGHVPALLGLVALELLERRARDEHERRVADVHVLEQAPRDLVDAGAAPGAPVSPARGDHEVL